MEFLLDVNLLVACAWSSHLLHRQANHWLDQCGRFATCPITQMGFLRIGMSAAHGASYVEARAALDDIVTLATHRFVKDAIAASALPSDLESRHDITDAHFIAIARRHRLMLATLDDILCRKPWAKGIAVNPLSR